MTDTLRTLGLMLGAFLVVQVITAQEPRGSAPRESVRAPRESQPDQAETESQARSRIERDRPSLGASEVARLVRGYRISPVRLDLARKDPALVGLGSYLVNATGGCNDCHTNPPFAEGGDPFRGEPKQVNAEHYLAGGVSFGPFLSRNLTPDTAGRPGGLTYPQFRETMRTGRDVKRLHPEISELLQVMPWPVYQDLTERDLRAMYEYLRAIPPAQPGTAPAPEPTALSGR